MPPVRPPRSGYRAPAVCDIVGITYRQLDYWARGGLVEPTVRTAAGSGSQRLYAFDDVVRLAVVKRLADAGVQMDRLRSVLASLDAHDGPVDDVTLAGDGERTLVLDDADALRGLLAGGHAVFAVSLGPLIASLSAQVESYPTETLPDDEFLRAS